MSVGTSQAPASTPQLHLVPTLPIWQLSVEQYHQMIQTGILTEDDPVELLEGWLIPRMPKNPPHCLSTELAREAIAKLLPSGFFVSGQEPLTTDDSEPEPDVMVVRGARRDYVYRHPKIRGQHGWPRGEIPQPFRQDRSSQISRHQVLA